ncbi:hypothetical protein BZA70DRAFT_112180 [Myxozyma melibiosi]|uniref:C2H2-type domain-containing protein n=1 Tax=Myxozyma melibiosi TaxID=54550 RepID=A0ABR1FAC1_9ASCO
MLSSYPRNSSSNPPPNYSYPTTAPAPSTAYFASPQSSSSSFSSSSSSSLSSAASTVNSDMDTRDAQSASFGSYGSNPSQPQAMPYEPADGSPAQRQHYISGSPYDPSPDASGRQYTQSAYISRPSYASDPRYAPDQRAAAGPPPSAYADPSVAALGGYQGYPPATGSWRAEWYPPPTNSFPPPNSAAAAAAASAMAGPPMGSLGGMRAMGAPNALRRPGGLGGVGIGGVGIVGGGGAGGASGRMGEFASNTVYSFVPLPGSTQQKRPRRRFEEIERIYTCGYNGCEKAYGTLNHLNAHVTMQNHGSKRTPDEFKETRKKWKEKKKEEEMRRKAENDARQAAVQQQQHINNTTNSNNNNNNNSSSSSNSKCQGSLVLQRLRRWQEGRFMEAQGRIRYRRFRHLRAMDQEAGKEQRRRCRRSIMDTLISIISEV